MPSEIGIKIDSRYEVLSELGRGGMGVVYKANDLKMDRLVAIKVMTAHISGRDESLERFLREAKSIAKMQHSNIVVVHDYGYHGDAPYIAMEYVEGMALDKLIASRVNLSLLTKVHYIIQVCQALQYAHERNIVHRDVKPGNIMVLESGSRVKLLDFGIARAGTASSLSKSGLAMGTTCYMSPEQTKGHRDLDARSDIFSAGIVLYELLAGTPPWTGDGDYEIMTKIINDPFLPLSTRLRSYPAGLDRVLERALAKDPAARYQTAERMAADLAELEAPLKEQVLEDALVQFEQGELLRARDLVSQILRVDTRHREALELSQKLQQIAQLQQRGERVQQLRQAAEQAIGQKQYQEALSAIEQAIAIDSANTELFHYRDLIRQELKRREDIRKKLELARKAHELNDLSSAQELVEKALEADPTDTQARMMKSVLEQEKKRQQLQEYHDEATRALTARAFPQAKRWILEIEAVDPQFPQLASLRKALADAEAQEKRQAEIEDLVQRIRQVLKGGDLAQVLRATEEALAKFPGDVRLARLRKQAEDLRDAAQRERAIQEQIASINTLAQQGKTGDALAAAENALQGSGGDQRFQAAVTQLRQNMERERLARAHQEIMVRAREAIRATNYEAAIQILTPARIDFPASKEIAETLRIAQEAVAQKAADRLAENARKRQVADALERALAAEPSPETQVRLAEDAARSIPGNELVEQVLARVRQRQQQIASAVEGARSAERSRNYTEAIRIWERIKELYPQYPELEAQVIRLKHALKPPEPPKPQPPKSAVEPPPPGRDFSATSIMAGAKPVMKIEASAPVRLPEPTAAPVLEAAAEPAPPPVISQPLPSDPKAKTATSKMLLWGSAGLASVLLAVLGYVALTPKKPATQAPVPKPIISANPPGVAPVPKLEQPQPKAATRSGKLLVQTNVDQIEVFVDGIYQETIAGTSGRLSIEAGPHEISVRKPKYADSSQPVVITPDKEARLNVKLKPLTAAEEASRKTEALLTIASTPGATIRIDNNNGQETKDGNYSLPVASGTHHIEVTLKGYQPLARDIPVEAGKPLRVDAFLKKLPEASISFSATPSTIQLGASAELKWEVKDATDPQIDHGIGKIDLANTKSVRPTETTTYTMTAIGADGVPVHKSVSIEVIKPLPISINFIPSSEDPIVPGGSIKLSWQVQNAIDVSLSPNVSCGIIKMRGSCVVSPKTTTNYVLTAKDAAGVDHSETVTIKVDQTRAAAPPTEDPEIKAILETIRVRYRNAIQHEAIAEVKKVWPGLRGEDEDGWKKIFSSYKGVTADFDCSDPVLKSKNTADCTCLQVLTYTSEGKVRTPFKTRVIIHLSKDPQTGIWLISASTLNTH